MNESKYGCLAIGIVAAVLFTFYEIIRTKDWFTLKLLLACFGVPVLIIVIMKLIEPESKTDKEIANERKQKDDELRRKIAAVKNIKCEYDNEINQAESIFEIQERIYWIQEDRLISIANWKAIEQTIMKLEKIPKLEGLWLYSNKNIISLESLYYYDMEGNLRFCAKKTGDSGGYSLAGALVGGAIAGRTGAIIGGRKAAKPVRTKLEELDSRKAVLVFFDKNSDYRIETRPYEVYRALNRLLPNKERNQVLSSET